MDKIKVAVIFGGKSAEHEISLRSANSIVSAMDPQKYDIQLIGIDKSGKWFLNENSQFLLNTEDTRKIQIKSSDKEITLANTETAVSIIDRNTNTTLHNIDVVFPMLHGTYGEDGTIQGMFKLLNIPFVGVDVLASAVGMDKDVTKRLMRDAGIPIADFLCITPHSKVSFEEASNKLGNPLFIKPANAGSSVGVHKVTNSEEYEAALQDAFLFDKKILIEEAIVGREVECAVLGNENPKASVIGEIIAHNQFYSYNDKYINAQGASLAIPAEMSEETSNMIRQTAIKAYQTICCEGLSRVDFFLKADNTVVLNEINTMPGFTSISMYPKLWEATGLPYSELIDELIRLAIQRHKRDSALKTTV